MIEIEKTFIELLLVMAKLKRSLTVSECIDLANDLISGTTTQNKSIQWKIKGRADKQKMSSEDPGS